MCLGKNKENNTYFFNNTAIKNSSEEKILGITIDNKLKFKSHVKNSVNSCKTNNMINKLRERALRLVFSDHVSDFEALLRKSNDRSCHRRNIQMLMIELSKIKNELAPPITDSMLNRRNIAYSFRNLQEFQSERKGTVFNGLETLSYLAPQPWTLLPEKIKQRNTIHIFKSDVKQWVCKECPCRVFKVFVPNLGFICHVAPILVLFII